MAATHNDELTGASPFWTMNVVNSALVSVLSGLYTVVALVCCLIAGSPADNKILPSKSSSSSDERRVAVITGSNGGIGYQSARHLVLFHNTDVVLACRSRDKALQAAKAINDEAVSLQGAASRATFIHPCDLSSLASVRQFAKALHKKYKTIHILVNNAGVNNTTEGRTVDDLDIIFQSNVLGHFLLTQLVLDLFPTSGQEGRIVNLSSVAHHFVDSTSSLDENYWKQLARHESSSNSLLPTYLRTVFQDCLQSYPPSKLATLLLAVELNRRYGLSSDSTKENRPRIRAIAVNPGAVASDIWRSFPSIAQWVMQHIFLSTEQGCRTTIAAAVGDLDKTVLYLQPYWMPAAAAKTAPFPVLEMMGPFVGYNSTQPRLPLDGGAFASQALWRACEDLHVIAAGGLPSVRNDWE